MFVGFHPKLFDTIDDVLPPVEKFVVPEELHCANPPDDEVRCVMDTLIGHYY